ncbi:MAG TPA: cation-translocating P-type ATPase [Verrucomicrobiae bacterium]|jgi:Cu+-exporting ATPase
MRDHIEANLNAGQSSRLPNAPHPPHHDPSCCSTDHAIPSPGAGGRPALLSDFSLSGMTCNNCARHVTEAIQSVAGVASAAVSLETNHATVRWRADAAPSAAAVVQAVKAAGYEARVIEGRGSKVEGGREWSPLDGWRFNVVVGLACTVPLMAGEWLFQWQSESWYRWASFALALLVQAGCGAKFYRGAWNQLKSGSSNMDTLVALGSTTAFAYSVWAFAAGQSGHLYFMEAAAIITLVSTGHWMEARMSTRAESSLRALLDLAPPQARRLHPDGSEYLAPAAELQVNDSVVLKPGDRVPTDGEVLEGESAVDESMLTGESAPVDKGARAKLYAGTSTLNGRLLMRVTATGEATALARIIAAVQRAQTSRANIQRLGDRVSNVFVPIVVLVAVAAALWWGLAYDRAHSFSQWLAHYLWAAHPPEGAVAAAFIIAAAVLIIACPCAMGLATPAAIMAGANAAARRGILIRDGVALEKAGLVTAVMFDKTGTLTQGKPAVAKFEPIPVNEFSPTRGQRGHTNERHALPLPTTEEWGEGRGEGRSMETRPSPPSAGGEGEDTASLVAVSNYTFLTPEVIMKLAATLARPSNHPLSQAMSKLSAEEVLISDWQEVRGAGVMARVADPAFFRPSSSRPEQAQIQPSALSQSLLTSAATSQGTLVRLGSLNWLAESGVDLARGTAFAGEWSAQGATILGLALDQILVGLVAVKDTLKAGAREVVEQLHDQQLAVYLVTGDNKLTAAAIALQAGIPTENVFAEVRPEQKAELVKHLQGRGQRVAFVGDGINDAPALEQADLGIAVSRASDIAREAADIILLNSEIEAVPESLGLAQATLRTIKQNLFWAFFYNAVGVPLAALGFMSPVLCALAMGFSDVIVIGNALRLRHWKR